VEENMGLIGLDPVRSGSKYLNSGPTSYDILETSIASICAGPIVDGYIQFGMAGDKNVGRFLCKYRVM
jgi:hypothetical protein